MSLDRRRGRTWTLVFLACCLLEAAPGRSAPFQDGTAASVAPRRDLQEDERRGGHTIARHVGRTDADLQARLSRERISAASTYTDLATAEQVVQATLDRSASTLASWQRRTGRRPNLALRYRAGRDRPLGRALERGGLVPVPCYDAVVVLRWREDAGDYFVLTSYPEVRR